MSYFELNQEKFIKDSLKKVYTNLTQFLLDTNYSNIPSLKLRHDIEEFKSKMEKIEKQRDIDKLNYDMYHNSNIIHKVFPSLMRKTNDPKLAFPNNLFYIPKNSQKNIFKSFADINDKKPKENSKLFKNKKHLNIQINSNNQYNEKYYKYNNDEKNKKFFHNKLSDGYNNIVINNDDISRGIYDMNIKKLIPKGVDVSPTMNLWGNPLKITGNEVKNVYKKDSSQNDVAPGEINRLIPNKYSINQFYRTQPAFIIKKYNSFNKNKLNLNLNNINEKEKGNKFNTNKLFITTEDNLFNDFGKIISFGNKTLKNIKTNINLKLNTPNNIKANTFYDVASQKKISIPNIKELNQKVLKTNNSNISSKPSKTFYKTFSNFSSHKNFNNYLKNIDMKNNIIIKYDNFELIQDSEFDKFKKGHEKNWQKIENILSNYKLLLEKLNMNKASIDSNKILKLIEFYKGKINFITNKNLIMCLNKKDLKEKGYDTNNENIIYEKIKIAFIIRIQKAYRRRLSYKKYQNLKYFNIYLIKTQKYIKGRFIRKKIKKEIESYRQSIHDKYIELFNKFKEEYNEIQTGPRIEIHINSLSYKGNYNNCLTDKYPMKESFQLSRLIKLIDPNLDIIYILPYELPEEIISYYFSIMEKLGIKDIDNRVTFIVPEATDYLPLNYSLSKLLFFSKKSIEKIKNLVKNKKCYIIPGIVGDIEENLSVALNIPMLKSPINHLDKIFNKSGIKELLEINNIPFPISAWNIITEDEFYSSLVHLISSYPNINIWIFKSNYDNNAIGIAYLNTDQIDFINEFRKKAKNRKNTTEKNNFRRKLFYELKNILIKYVSFAYPNLYKNWNDYLSHFLSNRGIIECCPTEGLSGIMGKPCIPIIIEPNGAIKVLPSYERINIDNFKNIINTSPQRCLDDNELINLGKKIGNILYNQGIIGYASIECITFHNGEIILYWCVDIKYGYTQTICDIQYCYFLYLQSLKPDLDNKTENLTSSNNDIDKNESFNYNIQFKDSQDKEKDSNNTLINKDNKEEIKEEKLLSKVMTFNIPFITCGFVYVMKLKEILKKYKVSNIIYNMKKREGIVLNLCDNLECGIFGICGVIYLDDYDNIIPELRLWRLIDTSVSILKEIIFSVQRAKVISIIKNFYDNKERSDKIDFQYILNKVKKKIKEKEQEQIKEEEKRRKLATSVFNYN